MTLAERYFLVCLRREGDFSILERSLTIIGLIAAGLSDLDHQGFIRLSPQGRIERLSDQYQENDPLAPLKQYLIDHPEADAELVVFDYVIRLSSHFAELFQAIGKSLTRRGMVQPDLRDSMINQVVFIPQREAVEELVWEMRWQLERPNPAPDMVELWHILQAARQPRPLLSLAERRRLKDCAMAPGAQLAKLLVTRYLARR